MPKENMNASERERVISAVESRLVHQHPGGATLSVLLEGVRFDQEWRYVPVLPDKQPARRYEYYEVLAAVENEIQRDENLTVLFVPVRPDDTP